MCEVRRKVNDEIKAVAYKKKETIFIQWSNFNEKNHCCKTPKAQSLTSYAIGEDGER
jgi:hypothetical protein